MQEPLEDMSTAAASDGVADASADAGDSVDAGPTMPADAPSLPRQAYTMTVEDVAALLFQYGFERDQRTIQRWCSAGKIKAILDHGAGDRYLIEPRSVDDMVATLTAERERQERVRRRPSPTAFSAPEPYRDTAATDPLPSRLHNAGRRPSEPDASPDAGTAPAGAADEVATLRDRVRELERELMSAQIDAETRKQVIAELRDFYNAEIEKMGERYEAAIEHALERSERVGALEAENRQLQGRLPAGTPEPTVPPGDRFHFTPHRVRSRYGDNPEAPPMEEGV